MQTLSPALNGVSVSYRAAITSLQRPGQHAGAAQNLSLGRALVSTRIDGGGVDPYQQIPRS